MVRTPDRFLRPPVKGWNTDPALLRVYRTSYPSDKARDAAITLALLRARFGLSQGVAA